MEPELVKEAIDYFDKQGKTELPDKYREAILTVFHRFPDRWFTANDFHTALKMSRAYAYKICEALSLTRIVEKKHHGRVTYYRFKPQEVKK